VIVCTYVEKNKEIKQKLFVKIKKVRLQKKQIHSHNNTLKDQLTNLTPLDKLSPFRVSSKKEAGELIRL